MTCCCDTCHESLFLQQAAVANGNGSVFDVSGYPAVSFQVYGTFAGGTDVAFEFKSGSAWFALPVVNASTGTASSTGIVSAAGTYVANTVGLQQVRARVLNYAGADSVNVVATAICEGDGTTVGGPSGGGGPTADVNVNEWAGVALTTNVLGETSDAAVTTNAVGSISSKLRGIVAILADVWSDALNALGVNVLAWGGTTTTLGQKAMAASVPVAIASDQSSILTQPFSALLEGGVTELIGINEQVDTVEYSEDVGVALGGTYSGEILNIVLISTEDGTGAIQRPQGRLFILDADPGVATGATTLGAAAFPTILGAIPVLTTDWTTTDTGGAVAWKAVAVAFHALSTIYFVWFQESASSWNDAAGDDEQLEFNFWYRRDS